MIELPPEPANAVHEWALEAATRVLRGDPQPSNAEVYKAARATLSQASSVLCPLGTDVQPSRGRRGRLPGASERATAGTSQQPTPDRSE